ncbi:SMI1/KNR4 family protein [Limibacter armeniacum]|uniref:SMI1/KNR4 family protein n=1 Tax=Limibacter armeniacum TaxID=466084 RepID=UPI002FE69103
MINSKIKYWQTKGIAVNVGANYDDILILEKQISFSFPEDFKIFYQSLNGFKERDWTTNMFSLFPLERIKEEYEFEQNEKNLIPICDYLISSHHLGYIKGEEGIFKDYNQTERVCNNLVELLDLIDSDSEKIY